MHESWRRSALILLLLAFAAVPAAHAGGQEREASGGQVRVPSTFGAKVVTEHVPVLPVEEHFIGVVTVVGEGCESKDHESGDRCCDRDESSHVVVFISTPIPVGS